MYLVYIMQVGVRTDEIVDFIRKHGDVNFKLDIMRGCSYVGVCSDECQLLGVSLIQEVSLCGDSEWIIKIMAVHRNYKDSEVERELIDEIRENAVNKKVKLTAEISQKDSRLSQQYMTDFYARHTIEIRNSSEISRKC